ncbi:MAG: alkaline phosphatase family protein, partial [Clostridia bacterium]|nr:alkaline phosphatase family protein [Clostridia bacterium]
GVDVLNKIASDSIMHKNMVSKVTSVFPSTTTNATTTLLTNSLVDNHKYLAWSMYFKEKNRCIDIYTGLDSYTKESVSDYLNTDTSPYFSKFETNREVFTVFPDFKGNSTPTKNKKFANTIEELGTQLVNICNFYEEKFVYCYCTEPDSTMHEFGVTSNEAIEVLNSINKMLTNLKENTKDTLFVLTADHGHINVKGYIDLYNETELLDCLDRPLSMESRAISFKLKPNMEEKFLNIMKKFSEDITLMKASTLIEKGVFGNPDNELKEFLGDYIGIGTNTFKIARFNPDKFMFKGHHTSLTEEEMYVPLIMIKNK